MRKWFEMRASGDGAAEISIYGSIGASWWDDAAVSASDFAAALKEMGDVSAITLRVNSPGGDVFDGVAIHNLLSQHPAKVTARVDGIAASAASFIVMAADEIIMPENAFMLVHEASGGAWGTADTMMEMAADLERINASMAAAYAARTGMDVDAVKSLMKEDRLMQAGEAKELGFATQIAEPVKMAASYSLRELPEAVRERVKAAMAPEEDEEKDKDEKKAEDDEDDKKDDPSNVVNLDEARAAAKSEGETEARAVAKEIVDICALAGFPEMASEFIAKRTPMQEVRDALVTAKAKKSADDEAIIGAHAETRKKAEARGAWDKIIAARNSRIR